MSSVHKDGNLAAFQNLGSWAGLTNPDKIFTFSMGDERRASVFQAAQKLRDDVPVQINALLDYDGRAADIYKGDPQGRYLLSYADQSKAVLSVKPRIPEETYILSDRVYREFTELGVNGPTLLPMSDGRMIGELGAHAICFATYTDGRHLKAVNLNEMYALGAALGRMRGAFNQLSVDVSSQIVSNGAPLKALVDEGVEHVLTDQGRALLRRFFNDQADSIVDIASRYQGANVNAVPCHGDVIPGNVIISNDDQVTFLDFDNVSGSLFNEHHDLGLAIGRIGFDYKGGQSARRDRDAVAAILVGYNGASDSACLTVEDAVEVTKLSMVRKMFGAVGQYIRAFEADNPPAKKIERFGRMYLNSALRLDSI